MNVYYTRNRTHAQPEQPYRSRYSPVQSQYPDATPATTPLPSLDVEQFEPDTIVPRRRAGQITRDLSPNRRATRGTNPLPPSTTRNLASRPSNQMMLPPEPPRSNRKRGSKNMNNASFLDHFIRIVLGIWKLFRDTPPRSRFVCIFLAIGLLLVIAPIASAFIQVTMPFLASVYVILGIIAAFIVIYDFIERRRG